MARTSPISFTPLIGDAALGDYALIRYHRRGYSGSSRAEGPPETYISRACRDAAALLQHLGLERAHIVGHSSGAVIALQLACERPDLFESLVLIEPPLLSVPSAPTPEALGPVVSRYFAGDAAGAVDGFMSFVGGPGWRSVASAGVPGGPEQAERDAATFFECELQGVGAWQCEVEKLKTFRRPVLFMWGENTPQFHAEARDLIHEWLPQTEDCFVRGATHMVMLDRPREAAASVGIFLRRVLRS